MQNKIIIYCQKGRNISMNNNIRNVCLIGHSSHGKTSVAEAMLYFTKATNRLGKVSEGNTVLDYDAEEKKRGFSVSLSVAPVEWKGKKINIIDTPGYLDFCGEVSQGLRVAGSAIIVVDGKAGVEVGTELAWEKVVENKVPRAFFINKFDDDECRFARAFKEIREAFGVSVCPVLIPLIDGEKVTGFIDLIDMCVTVFDKEGKHTESAIPPAYAPIAHSYRNMLYESIAETSEELMDKYCAGEHITREEAIQAIHVGFVGRTIAPVICGAATKMWGIDNLMDNIIEYFPSPFAREKEKVINKNGEVVSCEISPDNPTAAFVFKTVADPFVGKMSYFKVMSGVLKRDDVLTNPETGVSEKFAHIYTIKGKDLKEVDSLYTGDIGVTTKLAGVNTNDTFSANPNADPYRKIKYEEPYLRVALSPKVKGEEDKISQGITRLLEEDLTLGFVNDAETKQLVLSGIGDIHVDVTIAKLASRYGISVDLSEPRIAYREAIKKSVDCEGKHKKQSGGHGQYGHVKIRFAPGDGEGLEFTESCVGGSVPKNFHPAVIKGLEEAMQKGVLAGFPMVSLKADLYDGSYHDVDSSEMSFKLAASIAYKEGMKKASPIILEPVGALNVTIPDALVGDVLSTIMKRRGRVLGMTHTGKKGYQMVEAEVPMGELADYTTALRAMSQGRGSYTLSFLRYEETPANIAEKIIAEEAKKRSED